MKTRSAAFFAALALSLTAGTASASIIYVADVQLGPETAALATTVGPFSANQPSYYFGNSYFLDERDYLFILPDASTIGLVQFPQELKIDETSVAARVGANSKDGLTYFTGTRGLVYEFNARTEGIDDIEELGSGIFADSIATRGSRQVTIIAETEAASPQGYVVDFAADSVTHVFSLDGTDQAFYQNYAPNGLLYVLDYGNRRMLMLDPAQGFARTGEFSLDPGPAVANEPFGIGPNGNVYLGDGLGGGWLILPPAPS